MEIAAVIFFLIMLAVAFIAFRILKKTIKMAIRALIVLIILTVAIVGSVALWSLDGVFSSDKPIRVERTR